MREARFAVVLDFRGSCCILFSDPKFLQTMSGAVERAQPDGRLEYPAEQVFAELIGGCEGLVGHKEHQLGRNAGKCYGSCRRDSVILRGVVGLFLWSEEIEGQETVSRFNDLRGFGELHPRTRSETGVFQISCVLNF